MKPLGHVHIGLMGVTDEGDEIIGVLLKLLPLDPAIQNLMLKTHQLHAFITLIASLGNNRVSR